MQDLAPGSSETGKFGLFAAHPEIDGTSNNIERVKISIHWMVNAKKNTNFEP